MGRRDYRYIGTGVTGSGKVSGAAVDSNQQTSSQGLVGWQFQPPLDGHVGIGRAWSEQGEEVETMKKLLAFLILVLGTQTAALTAAPWSLRDSIIIFSLVILVVAIFAVLGRVAIRRLRQGDDSGRRGH